MEVSSALQGRHESADRDEDITYPDDGIYAEAGKRSVDRDEDITYPDDGIYAEAG